MGKSEINKRSRLADNSIAAMAATMAYLVARLFLAPFVLTHISLAEFGLWSLCFVVLSYGAFGAFGVNNAYIRYTARFHARGKTDMVGGLLSTGTLCMFAFLCVFMLLLFFLSPLILERFNTPPSLMDTARFMLLGTAGAFCLDLLLGGFRSVLEGVEEIALVKKIYTGAALLEILCILFFLHMGAGVKGMLYAYMVRVAVDSGGCIYQAFKKLPGLRVAPSLFHSGFFHMLFVFGGKVQVTGIVALLLSTLDRVIISSFMGLGAAGMFELGRKFPFTAKSVSGSGFGAFLPASAAMEPRWEEKKGPSGRERAVTHGGVVLLATLLGLLPLMPVSGWGMGIGYGFLPWGVTAGCLGMIALGGYLLGGRFRNDPAMISCEPARLYVAGVRFTNLLNLCVFSFLAATAGPLVNAWVGAGYGEAADVLRLLCLAYGLQQATGPVTLIFRGLGRAGRELEYLLFHGVLLLIWLPLGTIRFGLTGTAGALALAAFFSSAFLFWRSNVTLKVSWREFMEKTLLPGAAPLSGAGAVYLCLPMFAAGGRADAVTALGALGLLYAALVLPLVWFFVLTPDERETALSLVPRKRESAEESI